jgi:hypothetical protein
MEPKMAHVGRGSRVQEKQIWTDLKQIESLRLVFKITLELTNEFAKKTPKTPNPKKRI